MNLTLHVWRQAGPQAKGKFVTYKVENISSHASFLEMLDILNEQLTNKGEEPIAFEHDCREGICGACGIVINGVAHSKTTGITTCQLHMRVLKDGEDVWIEPWRAAAFPVLRDLVVDRSALDRIIQAGGYVSVNTGSAPEANIIPVPKDDAELSLDAAACIGCGACVAACPNASAMLFTAAKVSHLSLLPQGQVERKTRVRRMVEQMDHEGFGNCTNHGACQNVCPKEISTDFIARLNAEVIKVLVSPGDSRGRSDAS